MFHPMHSLSSQAQSFTHPLYHFSLFLGRSVVQITTFLFSATKSLLITITSTIATLWKSHILPFASMSLLFLQTPLGISVTLMTLSVLVMKIGQTVSQRYISTAFMIMGLMLSVYTGNYLLRIGFFPLNELNPLFI